jgi:glycosyltransferase involved in cell wall biosynthesis/SAM-dependent methyltransferase
MSGAESIKRVAFFSPLPPARSGIADYSEALAAALRPLVELEVFTQADPKFDAARFDAIVYQVGNNMCHDFVYEMALRHPGVVVLHESNLHHLIADLTIKRGNWDAYVRECEYDGGAAAREFAERVRRLEIGPDYEGRPLTRRILESARGVVVHSRFMEGEIRAAGFAGPIGVIPHGAWIPPADRNGYRERLGLDESTPLVGIFGFLKPYKRIAESLRAFRGVVRLVPEARMILVGETHPDAPVEPMIQSLGLSSHARVMGFAPMDDFVGYLAACDIVLNLRFPTVGESSGTLLRSLGLGKAVLVSEIGAFLEFPDDVCLKVPVGAGEEELIFEYLTLLISRPEVARELGARAKDYVARECSWPAVAERYVEFLRGVSEGLRLPAGRASAPENSQSRAQRAPREGAVGGNRDLAEYLRGWAQDENGERYLETHHTRLVKTIEITPPGGPGDSVLEMGAYLQITPALKTRLGYGEVRGCYFGKLGQVNRRAVTSKSGETFECCVDLFDAESDPYPYPDEHFTTVLCCELIEHLFHDPMHLMGEVNRILKPGGHFVLTTPNVASLRGISAILQGYHPGFFPAYLRPSDSGEQDARHNREYTPREVRQLFENSGFAVTLLETGEFRDAPHPEFGWIQHLLKRYWLEADLRGDGIYAVGRKTGLVHERYPEWLYS